MDETITSAKTASCDACGAKLTHVVTSQAINGDEPPNLAPFTCPACGHVGTLGSQVGQRIIRVETKQYRDPLGR